MFSSFDLFLFTKKDGITINEDRKVFLIRNFINFKEFYEKLALLKLVALVFETGDFLNIFLRYWSF